MKYIIYLNVLILLMSSCISEEKNEEVIIGNLSKKNIQYSEESVTEFKAKIFRFKNDNSPVISGKNLIKGYKSKYFYILDRSTSAVQKYNREGKKLSSFVAKGRGPKEIENAIDFTVDENGFAYILDVGNQKILALDDQLNFKNEFSPVNSFSRLSHISARDSGFIALNNPELDMHVFEVYDIDGKKKADFGEIDKFTYGGSRDFDSIHTRIMNLAKAGFYGTDIYVMYYTRPVFEVYDGNLELIRKIEYENEHIAHRRKLYDEKLKEAQKNPNRSPSARKIQYYFLDMISNGDGQFELLTLFDENSIYVLNQKGDFVKKIKFNFDDVIEKNSPALVRYIAKTDDNEYVSQEAVSSIIIKLKPL